jgi:hypothetical protein
MRLITGSFASGVSKIASAHSLTNLGFRIKIVLMSDVYLVLVMHYCHVQLNHARPMTLLL